MADDALLTLNLGGALPAARMLQIARELERDLSRAGVRTRPVEAPSVPGDRGEPVTLGVLALALISHGAVTALVECLKAHLSKEHGLTIKLARPDGMQVEVTGRNVDVSAVREALSAIVSARSG